MDKQRRKELVAEFKQIKQYMGVIQIKNNITGKVFIATYPNLKNKWLTLRGQLDLGRFANFELQKDWQEFGEEVFTYEIIEEKEVKEDTDKNWELKQMEKIWLEKLRPYDEKGYNRLPKE